MNNNEKIPPTDDEREVLAAEARAEEPRARRDPDPLWDRCYDDGSRMMSPANATELAGEAR